VSSEAWQVLLLLPLRLHDWLCLHQMLGGKSCGQFQLQAAAAARVCCLGWSWLPAVSPRSL
jgi:hypothetical protein